MVDYREILRLHSQNNSNRQIASIVGSGRTKVGEVIETAKSKGIEWPLDENATNEALEAILFPGLYQRDNPYLEPDYDYIHRELAKPGVTLTLLWEEYCHKCETAGKKPYMTTQFGDKYRRWARITKATMRIQHKPGDAMQVDWAGNTLPIYDSVTGEISNTYLFIAVLPCSCYVYAEICADMKLDTWLFCHVHAYEYFGGVTRLLIPDNLKTGVTSNTRYDTVLNRSYQELAEHYDTAIVPARVDHPRDKSLAEGSVKFASTWILASLRDFRFFSVDEAQTDVNEKLEELNSRVFKSRAGCRKTAFLEEEQAFLKPLPATAYAPSTWIPNVHVGNDYLISDGINKYSVPYDILGQKVDIRLTKNTVEVFYKSNRVALHKRENFAVREPIVNPDHMPFEHRKYLNYNSDDFMIWADSIGKKTAEVVHFFLTSGKEPEQGYKACASLTKLAERYGNDRIETVCERVLVYTHTPSIRIINTVLKSGVTDREAETAPKKNDNHNSYGITRGAAYYKKGGDSK